MDAGARSESSGCMVKWEAPHCQRKTRPGTGANTKWLGEARPLLYRGGTCVPELHVSAGISDGASCLVLHILVHLAVLLTGGHLYSCSWPYVTKKGSLVLDSSLPLLLHIVQEVEIEIALIVSKKQLFFSKNQPNGLCLAIPKEWVRLEKEGLCVHSRSVWVSSGCTSRPHCCPACVCSVPLSHSISVGSKLQDTEHSTHI